MNIIFPMFKSGVTHSGVVFRRGSPNSSNFHLFFCSWFGTDGGKPGVYRLDGAISLGVVCL